MTTNHQVAEASGQYWAEAVGQAVPVGYKQTELGIIPNDWEFKSIGEIANVFSGGTPNRKMADYWGGEIPWVTTTLIDGGEITVVNEFITNKGLDSSAAKWCKKGTILMAMYGQGKTRGKVAVLKFDSTINQACAAIELKNLSSNMFVLHVLNSMYEKIRELSNSGGQENLSSGIIKNIGIPYPSNKEQTAIANALSDVDALINGLEKLIAKKQAIKTATMQQLLTGRTRLPEFRDKSKEASEELNTPNQSDSSAVGNNVGWISASASTKPTSEQKVDALALIHPTSTIPSALREDGRKKGYKQSELGEIPEDWDVFPFGSITEKIIGGGTPSRTNPAYWGNEIPWITVKDFATFNPYSAQEFITKLGLQKSASNLIPKGILITSTRMALGKAVIYEVDVAINQDLKAIFPSEPLTTKYLYYWFDFNSTKIDELGSGSTVKGLSLSDLRAMIFILPPKQEQTAIATILSDMDTDIQTLQQRLSKTRQIKQGMMQELLTGKTRLLKPTAQENQNA